MSGIRRIFMLRVKRVCTALSAIALTFMLSATATAQPTSTGEYRNARRLGGSTSFHKPPLTNVASVRRMLATRGVAADIRKVLADSGIPETSDAVVALLSGVTTAVNVGSCADAN